MAPRQTAPTDRATLRQALVVAGVVWGVVLVGANLGTGAVLLVVAVVATVVGVRFGPRACRHLAGSPHSGAFVVVGVLAVIAIGLGLLSAKATADYCAAVGAGPLTDSQASEYQARC